MKFLVQVAFVATALLAGVAVGSPANTIVVTSSPFEGYRVEPLVWTGKINGVEVNATGTIQEIHKELSAQFPDFIAQLNAEVEADKLVARTSGAKTWQECVPIPTKPEMREADTEAIEDGIRFLRRIGGTRGVGVRMCGRVSCSWNSAIYICNDNPVYITIPSNLIADYTQDMLNSCDKYVNRIRGHGFGGRVFDNGGYQVNVQSDNC